MVNGDVPLGELHFFNWIDCNGVVFSKLLPKGVAHFRNFRGRKILVRKDLKVRKNTSTESDEGEVFNWPQNRL